MKCVSLLLLLLVLPALASAWGPVTHGELCRGVVSEVWGKEGVRCLDKAGEDYCILVSEVIGGDAHRRCMTAAASGRLNILNLTDDFYNDVKNHKDYTKCPLWAWNPHRNWICPSIDKPTNPSNELAQNWFKKAVEAKEDCLRIQAFCTGALYYTDGYYPLHQVNTEYLTGCKGESLADEVDSVIKKKPPWNVSKSCSFTYWKQKVGRRVREDVIITFRVDDRHIEGVRRNLTLEASKILHASGTVSEPGTEVAEPTATTLRLPEIGATTTTQQAVEEGKPFKPPEMTTEEKGGDILRDYDIGETGGYLAEIVDYIRSLANETGMSKGRGKGRTLLKYFMFVLVLISLSFAAYVAVRKPGKGGRV
jgi:hypothetical protein